MTTEKFNPDKMNCPQCGRLSDKFAEDVCVECQRENQAALDLYNAEYSYWRSLSPSEQEAQIKWAMR